MLPVPHDRSAWRDMIRRIARRIAAPDEAEDMLQAAYVRLAEFAGRSRIEAPAAYVVRTAVNLAVDAQRREALFDRRAPVETLCSATADTAPLQDEVFAARVRLSRMREGLDRLSPRTREVFLLHRLDGLKYREIAERLGISQSAVEKHVARAVLFLAEWMDGC